jgi:hypothetical protein
LALTFAARAHADAVTEWNAIAESTIRASTPSPPLQLRAMAIVNASIYDAVNGIARKYDPYFINVNPPPGARQEAAAAQAAYTALKGLFPAQSGPLDEALAASLAKIPGAAGKSKSIARGQDWGEQVALAILAWRATDGLTTPTPPYLGGNAIGQWRSVPDGNLPGIVPQFANLTPFTMTAPSQFRPGPPPALTSAEYTADFNEVKAYGRVDSTVRTLEQTQAARLWAVTSPLDENAVARSVVPASNSLVDNARLFALINFAGADAAISGLDTKYAYGFWRPFHAIRFADMDGNPDTAPDAAWNSLVVPVPNHPEYISTHSIITGATMRVLELLLGDDIPFTLSSPLVPGVVVDYPNFAAAVEEVGPARIWGGLHFRFSCRTGAQMGFQIGTQAVQNHLRPR